MHDNHLKLKESNDFVAFNEDMWNMYSDRYGCDIVI